MNFNPFSPDATVVRFLHRYPQKLNMFDRIVGRPDQMGILDYALGGIPFLIKLALYLTKGKSKAAYGIFATLSLPLAFAKFLVFVATSPLALIAWGIKQLVKKEVDKHHISAYTTELNKLLVRPAALPGEDPDRIRPVPLSEVIKLHDGDFYKYAIRANNFNELQLVTFPRGVLVATIDTSPANLFKLSKLVGPEVNDRVGYFMTRAGKDIFDYDAKQLIHTLVKQEASTRMTKVYDMLVNAVPAEPKKPSFAIVNKDIRKRLAREFIVSETFDKTINTGLFKPFTPEVREEALIRQLAKPGV